MLRLAPLLPRSNSDRLSLLLSSLHFSSFLFSLSPFPPKTTLHYTLQEGTEQGGKKPNNSSNQSGHRSTYAVIRCRLHGFLRSEGGWHRGGGGREEELRRMPHHLHTHVARRADRSKVSVQRLRNPVPEEKEARPWPRSKGASSSAAST